MHEIFVLLDTYKYIRYRDRYYQYQYVASQDNATNRYSPQYITLANIRTWLCRTP